VLDRPDAQAVTERRWKALLHDDAHNRQSWVVIVLRVVLKVTEETATRLMTLAEREGKAVVFEGAKQATQTVVTELRSHQLTATLEQA
jgi:ATP-dependent Clp protease adapter protein ClpS